MIVSIILFYILTIVLSLYFLWQRKKINFLLWLNLILFALLVCWRLFFINIIISKEYFAQSPIFFALLLFLVFFIRRSSLFIFKYKKKTLMTKFSKSGFFYLVYMFIEAKNIFVRKIFFWYLEEKLYNFSYVAFSFFKKKTVVWLFLLPNIIFYVFFLKHIFFKGSLLVMLSWYSFSIIFQVLLVKVIVFAGVYGNLYALQKIFDQKATSFDFYKGIMTTTQAFISLNCGQHVFFDYTQANLKEAIKYFSDTRYLYFKFFFVSLSNLTLSNRLNLLKKKLFNFTISLMVLFVFAFFEMFFYKNMLTLYFSLFEFLLFFIFGFCLLKPHYDYALGNSIELQVLGLRYWPNYEQAFREAFEITNVSALNKVVSFQDYSLNDDKIASKESNWATWFTENSWYQFLFNIFLWLLVFFCFMFFISFLTLKGFYFHLSLLFGNFYHSTEHIVNLITFSDFKPKESFWEAYFYSFSLNHSMTNIFDFCLARIVNLSKNINVTFSNLFLDMPFLIYAYCVSVFFLSLLIMLRNIK